MRRPPADELALGQLRLAALPDAGRPAASADDWYGAGELTQAWAQLIWAATGGEGE